MKLQKLSTGERYDRDVMGMPCFTAASPFVVYIGGESMKNAVALDDERCAIALGCKQQLQTPYVSVGRYRADIALPHPEGVVKEGYGTTRWAVVRFTLSPAALAVVIAADTEKLGDGGVLVQLNPPRPSDLPSQKKPRNTRFRVSKGIEDGRGKRKGKGQDALTLMGVRDLTGQRKR